jgi:hypothetical protein
MVGAMAIRIEEWVEGYIDNGFFPVPVPLGKKGAIIREWQKLRITHRDISEHFDGKPTNVGLILGIGGVTDIDLDCEESLPIADHFLPETGFIFGRKSTPRAHRFYRLDKPIPSRKYLDPLEKNKDEDTLLELRCAKRDGTIGLQTVVPPSLHESGERLRFISIDDPAEVNSDDLSRAADFIAAAAILIRHWPGEKSGRNETFLGLHGTLARGGFPLEDAIHLAQGIYLGLFGDAADMEQAAREAQATYKKFEAGDAVTGFPRLCEFVDEKVVRRALQWLGVTGGGVNQPVHSRAQKPSQANDLVALAAAAELFHTPDDEAYAAVELDSHREIWRLKDKSFRRWLAKKFHDQHHRVPTSQAMTDALGVLEGKAIYSGPQHSVFVRIARLEDVIYLDLGDKLWRAVRITASDWKVVRRPKVRFRRPHGLEELPIPETGGSTKELRKFVNIGSQRDWVLMVAWLVDAFHPEGPFPILVLHGEQGSAKTTTARVLRSLIDPNKSPLRSPPHDERDVMIAAQNSRMVAFDNISYLAPWLSDALCRLATGGGYATRALYTDDEEKIIDEKRPVLLNGIDVVGGRGDLLDRSLVLQLPEISDAKRTPEEEVWKDFGEAQPRILGALLDAVSGALRNRPNVNISQLPRMADFAIFATAAEESLGWPEGTVGKAIANNRREISTLPLDDSPITPALRNLLHAKSGFKGTATALLQALEYYRSDSKKHDKGWPRSVRALSAALRRLAPALRAADVHVRFRQTSGSRSKKIIEIENKGDFCDAYNACDAESENDD